MNNVSLIGTDIYFAASKHRKYRLHVASIFRRLIDFLQDNGLTTRTILARDEKITERLQIMRSDLTDEGFEFYSSVEQKWLRAIDSGTEPTDISILKSELRRIRRSE